MMTRRERLMASLQGRAVDRPAVSFYEIGGFEIDPSNPDEFNIYNDPSWRPLIELAEEHTDLIRMRGLRLKPMADNCRDEFFRTETWQENSRRFTKTLCRVARRTLTALSRRDAGVDTVWQVEHLLKDADDLKAYLELPDEAFGYAVDCSGIVEEDQRIGDRGIVMIDTEDPICMAASLFSMEDFTIVAMTDQALFHRLLEKLAGGFHARTETVAKSLPGYLWRIYGAEFCSEPYLPPRLFDEYVVRYTGPMVQAVRRHGGYARIHCHGRISAILPSIVKMGASAIDPIEPPPQGDMPLAQMRRRCGKELTLFGNLEARDIENMPPREFEKVVALSLRDGTAGEGKGFVLMPSASPYGRTITPRTLANYQSIVRLATGFRP